MNELRQLRSVPIELEEVERPECEQAALAGVRQEQQLLDHVESGGWSSEKDEIEALKLLLRKVITKKYNNKHIRRRGFLYLGLAALLLLLLLYKVTTALQCQSSQLIPAYEGDITSPPLYYQETQRSLAGKTHRLSKRKSDSLPLNRPLFDYRPDVCRVKRYRPTTLTVSVVLVTDGSPASALLRTIASAVGRTHRLHFKEVVLVVIPAQRAEVERNLYQYSLSGSVKVVEAPAQASLSLCRNIAAAEASGDVLVFVPEATEFLAGWAEPLLEAIQDQPNLLAGLSMDEINPDSFEQVEHVPWHLISLPRWDLTTAVPIEIPEHERNRRIREGSFPDAAPVQTPVLQFAPWAVGREVFLKKGGLDQGMSGTRSQVPGDLLELSIRWWCCGGEVAYLPCSKVAPVTLRAAPYPDSARHTLANAQRTAALWARNHMSHFIDRVPAAARQTIQGDPILRKVISDQSCNNLSWYLANIATDWIFGEKTLRSGVIKSVAGNVCVDNMGFEGRYSFGRPEFYGCHGGHTQHWLWHSASRQLKTETGKCVVSDVYWHDVLTLKYCEEGEQWNWEPIRGNVGKLLYKDLCLEWRAENRFLFYTECKGTPNQEFTFEKLSAQ